MIATQTPDGESEAAYNAGEIVEFRSKIRSESWNEWHTVTPENVAAGIFDDDRHEFRIKPGNAEEATT